MVKDSQLQCYSRSNKKEHYNVNQLLMNKMEERSNKPILEHVTEKKMRSSCINKRIIKNVVLESPWKPQFPTLRVASFNNVISNTPCHLLFSGKQSEDKCDLNSDKKFKCVLPKNLLSRKQNGTHDSITSTETAKKEIIIRPICNQEVSSNAHPDVHVRRHSSPSRYDCTECGKTFSQLRNFKYHLSVHRGTKEFSATCSVCGKHFNDRSYLSSHMKIHRNRKEYKCSYCPKSFNQRVAYNMHVRIHTGVKPHVCEECGKAFSRKMLLSQHKRTHSGERPYACPFCDKRFADRSNMSLHRRLHTGIKPFCCSVCSKSFTKKHHLKSHLNFHTGDKPYSCPKCNLAFTQSSNMRTHYKKCSA